MLGDRGRFPVPGCGPTCQRLDAGPLEEPRRTVLIVPVIHVPAVVDIAVLLLNLNVVIVGGHRGRHLGLSAAPPHQLLLRDLLGSKEKDMEM